MNEYTITITGDYDILVLSPQMIYKLIEKVKDSDTKELVITAEEILPQGYSEYLTRVLQANLPIKQSNTDQNEIYKTISQQIDKLKIGHQKCFDKVDFFSKECATQFLLSTNEYFYMLVKQERTCFSYIFKDLNGKNAKVTLIYQNIEKGI